MGALPRQPAPMSSTTRRRGCPFSNNPRCHERHMKAALSYWLVKSPRLHEAMRLSAYRRPSEQARVIGEGVGDQFSTARFRQRHILYPAHHSHDGGADATVEG